MTTTMTVRGSETLCRSAHVANGDRVAVVSVSRCGRGSRVMAGARVEWQAGTCLGGTKGTEWRTYSRHCRTEAEAAAFAASKLSLALAWVAG